MAIVIFMVAMFLITFSFIIAVNNLSSSKKSAGTFIIAFSKGSVRCLEKMIESNSNVEKERKELSKKSSMF